MGWHRVRRKDSGFNENLHIRLSVNSQTQPKQHTKAVPTPVSILGFYEISSQDIFVLLSFRFVFRFARVGILNSKPVVLVRFLISVSEFLFGQFSCGDISDHPFLDPSVRFFYMLVMILADMCSS